jgi:DNA-binding NarL/FixJ family response regulator
VNGSAFEERMADNATRETQPAATYRVALLADVRLYRDGLAAALSSRSELEMLGAAPVNDAGLELLAASRPDIVLLEAAAARIPATIHAIRGVVENAKVIAFAIGDEERDAILCAEAGVSGYVSSEASLDDLVGTIVRVARGEFPCSPRVAALLAQRISSLAAQREPEVVVDRLTARELQILRLIDQGLSNKEIARRLDIGVSTVKNHVHNILDKTSASRRAQAAAHVRTPTWIFRSMARPDGI